MRSSHTKQLQGSSHGFTIVELLIVIVVIAILAAIAIVSYNGIQERARASEVSSALAQAAKKIKLWQVDNPGVTPTSLASVGITGTSNVTLQYKPKTEGAYCITGTSGSVSYKITEVSSPTSGGCAGHGQGGVAAITNLATNPSFEISAGWNSNNGSTYPTAVENTIVRSGNRSRTGWNTNGVNVLLSLYSAGASDVYGIPITEGGTYTASHYFRAEIPHHSTQRVSYRLEGTYTSGTPSSTITGTPGQWTQLSHTFSIPEGADRIRLVVDVASASSQPIGTRAYVDDIMLVKGTSSASYASGDSTDWDWNGTPHNSTSSGPAL